MPPKGEFEVSYFGAPDNPAPCGGVNFATPYTALPANDLAPGTVNTQTINGFLCSSPWVASSPFSTTFNVNTEYVLGVFNFADSSLGATLATGNVFGCLVVTNVGVYYTASTPGLTGGGQLKQSILGLVHTWAGGELNTTFLFPGQAVTFIEINGICYFTGLMLKGIFAWGAIGGIGGVNSFLQVTNYVAGRFIGELAGRLVVAECLFPGGGGTGTAVLPTIAWSGVGIFGQAWDGNPAHDVWNPLNQAFFNGNIGGFNLLSDVPDHITFMASVGQSIVLFRPSGIEQQDPNSTFSNSGIQPYNWYHMWSSIRSVGSQLGTAAQYGDRVIFRSTDNFYSLALSSGLTAVGSKVIAKVVSDQRSIEYTTGIVSEGAIGPYALNVSFWNFASIFELDGQLHYFLTLNAYTTNTAGAVQNYTCLGYDLNLSEGSWSTIDFGQYFQTGSAGPGFLAFSCPLNIVRPYLSVVPTNAVGAVSYPTFLLFGAFTSLGNFSNSPTIAGTLFQLVPFNYDFNSNPISTYIALQYPPLSVPNTTIVFRGETLTLGHRIITRRLRLQADNAPMPTVPVGAVQQAQVTMRGAGPTETASSPVLSMQGNAAPTGQQAIRTYYGDVGVNSETVQPTLTSVFSSTNAWQNICAFRIASASLIGNDATGTSQ